MRRAVIVACLGVAAARAGAQDAQQVAVIGCQHAAVREVRAQRSEADSVRFSPRPIVVERSKRETQVHGAGQYLDRGRREWRPFLYDCFYNRRSAMTRVKLEIDSSIGTM